MRSSQTSLVDFGDVPAAACDELDVLFPGFFFERPLETLNDGGELMTFFAQNQKNGEELKKNRLDRFPVACGAPCGSPKCLTSIHGSVGSSRVVAKQIS